MGLSIAVLTLAALVSAEPEAPEQPPPPEQKQTIILEVPKQVILRMQQPYLEQEPCYATVEEVATSSTKKAWGATLLLAGAQTVLSGVFLFLLDSSSDGFLYALPVLGVGAAETIVGAVLLRRGGRIMRDARQRCDEMPRGVVAQ